MGTAESTLPLQMLETHAGSLDDLIVSNASAFKKWSKQRAKMQLPTLPELPGYVCMACNMWPAPRSFHTTAPIVPPAAS